MQSVVGELLGAVSKNEIQQDRPMISAIAVGAKGKPGDGFFLFAQELGVFHEGGDPELFWESECKKIYEEWKITYRISTTKK